MKILCLDGGGVFGKVQARILQDAGGLDKFDCFVGTSIGATQAMAFAAGLGDKVKPSFFDEWMPQVFKASWLRKINIFTSKYPDTGLNKALVSVFDAIEFGEMKKPAFVTAANIGQKTLKVFSSSDFDDGQCAAWEIARAATAAETYFPSWKGYADGGVLANNPSMVGLAAAVRVLGVKLSDIEVFSIGTGDSSGVQGFAPKTRPGWGVWMIEALLNGAANKMHEYFVLSLVSQLGKYERHQFIREPDWKMDDPSCMDKAEKAWAVEIQQAVAGLKSF